MAPKLRYVAVVALAGLFTCLLSAHASSTASQSLALHVFSADVSQPPAPGQSHAPIALPRHFANPLLLGQVKAALAAGESLAKSNGASHGKPSPSPTSTSSSAPSSSATPVPISPSALGNPLPGTTGFDALSLWSGGGYEPPDTTVGAGNDYVVEAVNVMGAVYDKSGSLVLSLNTASCATNPGTDVVSDPRVLYDAGTGTWFISTMTFSPIGDASWNLLFSQTPAGTSGWYCLVIPTSSIRNPDGSVGNFPDFPKMGISSDKLVLTGDAYSLTVHHRSQSYKFQGTEFVVINKNALVTLSSSIPAALFAPGQGDYAIEPAQQLSRTGTLYMAAVNSAVSSTSNIDVWTINGVPGGTPALQTPTVTSVPIDTIFYPPNAQQAGTTTLIDVNDDSLLDAVYRDGSLWVSANDGCTPQGDTAVRSCMRFIDIDPTASPMKVHQDFDYADPGMYYYYPAIRTDGSGDLLVAFSGSSSGSYASAYAGMQPAGAANELTYLSLTRAGDSPYTISPPRWGDYSGAAVDAYDGSIWLGAEYATSITLLGPYWGTSITHVVP